MVILKFFGILLLLIIFSLGGFSVGSDYQKKLAKKDECGVSHKEYTVKITTDSLKPDTINAKRCDRLVFYNADDKQHGITFGVHDKHEPYGEFAQEYLQPKERIALKLFKTGTYFFHDHLYEDLKGEVTIK